MLRRWFIRGCFTLPLLLCVVGWGRSHCKHEPFLWERGLTGPDPQTWVVGVRSNAVHVFLSDDGPCHRFGAEECWAGQYDRRSVGGHDWRFLGFRYTREPIHEYWRLTWVVVPFWFLTTLSALSLLRVCWKTRPTTLGGAFPVEVKVSGRA